MHEETEELMRIQRRLKRLNTSIKPSPAPGISLGGSSSQPAPTAPPNLPSFLDERREKVFDAMTQEAISLSKQRVAANIEAAYKRIDAAQQPLA